jgi:hypothetical protein
MTDKPIDLDLNNVDLGTPAQRAAESVEALDVVNLFQRLEDASNLWSEPTAGPREAALAALAAVTDFVSYDRAGRFSRPLVLLAQEVRHSPAPMPGNILPPTTRGQSAEASRRGGINRLKACAAYSVDRFMKLADTRQRASDHVAAILVAHQFPLSDYILSDGSPRDADDVPAQIEIAARVEDWNKKYPTNNNEPGRIFRSLIDTPPYWHFAPLSSDAERYALSAWLKSELRSGGFDEI